MMTLHVENGFTVLTITEREPGAKTLVEQAAPYVAQAPFMVLNMHGILLTSMLIGELLRLHRGLTDRWAGRPVVLGLVNLTDTSRQALERARLDSVIRLFSSLDEALAPNARSPLPSRKSTA